MTTTNSDTKLGELILYISQKSARDTYFGAIKLNKILYFSDFIAYGRWGKPITGAQYQHLKLGPAPVRLLPVRKELEEARFIAVQPIQVPGGRIQHRTVNLREPDLSVFDAREIALVDEVIEALRGLNATEASELSHLELGWKLTEEGDVIDYRTVFLSDEKLSESEIRRLERELEKEAQAA